jgi:hypothetical protein
MKDDSPSKEATNATSFEPARYAGLSSLPLLARYPIIFGAISGVLLRLMFSGPSGSPWSAMAGWFIFLAPIVVGMVTVYLAERQHRRSWNYYIVAPLIATMLFVLGTLLILIEGLICAIVIVPMFGVLGMIGGLAMGLICRLTRWPKQTLYSFAALPVLLALFGGQLTTYPEVGYIERSILIRAPASVVWQNLNDIQDISAQEMEDALAMQIGVPMPLSGKTQLTPQGNVRRSRWGAHVYFDEVIQDWQPERYLRWTYRFSKDSFPREALDDHVVIGGHYFDVLDTSFTLAAEGDATRLTTRTHYRLSTHFNFYADWAAQLLLGNLSDVGLRLYRSRSELEANKRSPTSSQEVGASPGVAHAP